MFVAKPHFSYKYQSTQHTHGGILYRKLKGPQNKNPKPKFSLLAKRSRRPPSFWIFGLLPLHLKEPPSLLAKTREQKTSRRPKTPNSLSFSPQLTETFSPQLDLHSHLHFPSFSFPITNRQPPCTQT